jgi:hypothetical protein
MRAFVASGQSFPQIRTRAAVADHYARAMRLATAGLAAALLFLLGGCTAPTPVPTVAPSPTPTPTEVAAPEALTCDELVPPPAAAAALAGNGDPAPALESRMPVWNVYEWAVTAAGGLNCSWRVGDSATYLVVDVLPDAADAWHAHNYGDGTEEPTRTVAGVQAADACGTPGCMISAPVAGAWTRIQLRSDGSRIHDFRGDGSPFAGMSDDEVLAGLDVAATAVFSALTTAEPERLVWTHDAAAARAATSCDYVLPAADLAELNGYAADWEVAQATERELAFLRAFAQERAGFLHCNAMAPAGPPTGVVVAPGAAWLVREFAGMPEVPIGGAVVTIGGAAALEWCTESRNWCTVVVAVGDAAVQVSDDAQAAAIAEAIVARAG